MGFDQEFGWECAFCLTVGPWLFGGEVASLQLELLDGVESLLTTRLTPVAVVAVVVVVLVSQVDL